jgi:hypothetical protein
MGSLACRVLRLSGGRFGIARYIYAASAADQVKETYYRGKRDLLQRQKRPAIEAKETYYRGKR